MSTWARMTVTRPAKLADAALTAVRCGCEQALKENFEAELFTYLTAPLDVLQTVIFSLVVSGHAPGEEYIDDHNLKWIQARAKSSYRLLPQQSYVSAVGI